MTGSRLLQASVPEELAAAGTFAQFEQRLLCVILVMRPSPATRAAPRGTPDGGDSQSDLQPSTEDPERMLTRWAAYSEWLSDGSLLITLTERGTAADLARQAARIALQLGRLWPTWRAALATGLGTIRDGSTSGEAIRRVLDLAHFRRRGAQAAVPDGAVLLDGLTAGLIDGLFDVERLEEGLYVLLASGDSAGRVRAPAGQRTPCVGRQRELATLTALIEDCVEQPRARAALVLAPQGRGKSRLRHELCTRLRATHPRLTVLIGCSDPLSSGVSAALLTDCLRRYAGIALYDPPASAREKLTRAVQRLLTPQQLVRALAPLCALVSQQIFYDGSLPNTLHERGISREQIEDAFVQLATALTALGPVLLAVEDLQFADALSVRILHRVLIELDDRPLTVLGLGRPEVHAIFPKLWEDRRLQELQLDPLMPPAAQQLVESMLGRERAAAVLPRIVEHGRGNALFIEELVLTSLARPDDEALPDTLIALMQQRLLRLPIHAVRVVRAASVFGMSFWEEAIGALLSPDLPAEHIDGGLQVLFQEQLISRQRESRFPHTAEYRFRHALTLAAASSLLSQHDRELGSAVAARYRP